MGAWTGAMTVLDGSCASTGSTLSASRSLPVVVSDTVINMHTSTGTPVSLDSPLECRTMNQIFRMGLTR